MAGTFVELGLKVVPEQEDQSHFLVRFLGPGRGSQHETRLAKPIESHSSLPAHLPE